MTIPTAAIISYLWSSDIKELIGDDTWLDYYIHDSDSPLSRLPEATGMSYEYQNNAKFYFHYIGKNTGLKTREVDSDEEADISVFQVPGDYFVNQGNDNTIGLTSLYDSYIDILFLESDSTFDTKSTLVHEIGHSVGLRHPYGDGFNSDYTTEDTIMSYNDGYYGGPVSNLLTDADQAALKEIWGENGTNYDLRVDPTALNEDLTYSSSAPKVPRSLFLPIPPLTMPS